MLFARCFLRFTTLVFLMIGRSDDKIYRYRLQHDFVGRMTHEDAVLMGTVFLLSILRGDFKNCIEFWITLNQYLNLTVRDRRDLMFVRSFLEVGFIRLTFGSIVNRACLTVTVVVIVFSMHDVSRVNRRACCPSDSRTIAG
jgi:hypothetical protein